MKCFSKAGGFRLDDHCILFVEVARFEYTRSTVERHDQNSSDKHSAK